MAWFRITLTDAEQAVVDAERDAHPDAHVRRKMLVLRLLHCGVTRGKTASGRQRFNVLGAWDAVTRALTTVTNTTVVNTDTMCQLLRAVAARRLVGPVTPVMDNARDQRNDVVKGLAKELGIQLLFLPSYSPNRNLIERVWRFTKRKAVYGKYHPTFADFRAAVQSVLDGTTTTHADRLVALMTLNFQEFENVSLLTA
jgi:transposase